MHQGQKRWVKPDFNSAESLNPLSYNKINKRVQLNTPKLSVVTGSNSSEDSLLINKCIPQSSSELVVQKKKIVEVKEWLTSTTTGQPRLLLLKGPPGCGNFFMILLPFFFNYNNDIIFFGKGKFQTLSLLCKELDILLVEWDEPMK